MGKEEQVANIREVEEWLQEILQTYAKSFFQLVKILV